MAPLVSPSASVVTGGDTPQEESTGGGAAPDLIMGAAPESLYQLAQRSPAPWGVEDAAPLPVREVADSVFARDYTPVMHVVVMIEHIVVIYVYCMSLSNCKCLLHVVVKKVSLFFVHAYP